MFKKEMDSNKRLIMDQFEKVKTGKLDASVLAMEYGIDASKFQGANSMHQSSYQDTSQKKFNQQKRFSSFLILAIARPRSSKKASELGTDRANKTDPHSDLQKEPCISFISNKLS